MAIKKKKIMKYAEGGATGTAYKKGKTRTKKASGTSNKNVSAGAGKVGTQKTYTAKTIGGPSKYKSEASPSKKASKAKAKAKAASDAIKSKVGKKTMTKAGMKKKGVTGKEIRTAKRTGGVKTGSSPTTTGYKKKK